MKFNIDDVCAVYININPLTFVIDRYNIVSIWEKKTNII